MRGALAWMAGNPVAANLLMGVFVVGGLVLGPRVKQEVFPEVTLDRVQVSVAYPGAGPAEVEDGILRPVEERVAGLDGVKELRSVAREGVGVVTLVLAEGHDPHRVLQDVKGEVDRLTSLPRDAERPVVAQAVNRREVVSLVVYGEVPEGTLRHHAETIRDDLLALPGITQVELGGVRPYEISIEVPEANLRRYGLTLEGIAARVRRGSQDLPGGTVKAAGGEVLLRTTERRTLGAEYADIPVVADAGGARVRLGDLAEVRDGFAETDEFARFDGQPAAMVRVFRVGDQKPTELSEAVARYAAEKGPGLPPGLSLASWNDTSDLFRSRRDLLLKNAALGLVLVFAVLGLFLELRLAVWVMLGIPISFLGALLLMPGLGVSLNMISLFAFILALGIVVDDAIVVGENVYDHRQRGAPYAEAAVTGAWEVGGPVVFSVLTTVAAFVPLLFVTGTLGKFMGVIPVVVISILLVSLVESLFVLPAHLAGRGRDLPLRGPLALAERVRRGFGAGLAWFIRGPYRGLLALALEHRYTTVAAAVALLLLTVGLVGSGLIKFRFMPEVDSDVVTATLQLPRGAPVAETARVAELLTRRAQEVVAAQGAGVARHLFAVVGSTLAQGGPVGGGGEAGTHRAEVALLLAPSERRGVPSAEIAAQWREAVGEVPGVETLTFASNLVRLGANLDVRLAHADPVTLGRATDRLRAALAEYPGVRDVADSRALGARELNLTLKPEAAALGVTEEDLGRQVRGAFFGAEALRLQRGRHEVRVMVRYPAADRRSRHALETLRVRTPGGGELPLAQAAHWAEARGPGEIHRSDQKRVVNVTASVDDRVANAEAMLAELKADLLPRLLADHPGLSFDLEGEEKERRDSLASLRTGFGLALFAIYALLAVPFRSYSQPLLIMAAIPFGAVGAVLGHWVLGFSLSMLSVFGLVALSGVVVNASLLLIDRANQARRDGATAVEAALDAGQRRFRPILLTSLTTFFGLVPILAEQSVQAQFLIPMAISLAFGVLFATVVTLALVPALYLVLEDLRRLLGLPSRRSPPTG